MKIATLQLAPRIGDVEWNIKRANELLYAGNKGSTNDKGPIGPLRPDILVLPELALTGELVSICC